MAGRPFHFIFVGKLKQHFVQEGAQMYLERLRHFRTLRVTEVRDADARLREDVRTAQEGERILKTLDSSDIPIVLDERGKQLRSVELAALIRGLDEKACGSPCFIIGGPFGLAGEVRRSAHTTLALSALTLPHELARLLLLEQLYRAETILRNSPYHH